MINTEATIMAMELEGERQLRHHMEEGRILQALAERPDRPERPDRDGVLPGARRLIAGVRRDVRRWLALPWDARAPRVAASAATEA